VTACLLLVVRTTGSPPRCQRTVGRGSPDTKQSNDTVLPVGVSVSRGGRYTAGATAHNAIVFLVPPNYSTMSAVVNGVYKANEMN